MMSGFAERAWLKVYGTGWSVYSITFALMTRGGLGRVDNWWSKVIAACAWAAATWIFWLVILYLNTLVIALARRLRWYSRPSNLPAQNFLVLALTTLFAFALTRDPGWSRWLGFLWLGGLGLNLIASAATKFIHATTNRA
jgi:hypothetical protein